MKFTSAFLATALALAHGAAAHYRFTQVSAGGVTTSDAIRLPATNSPIRNIELPEATCNSNAVATQTIEVAAGSEITFIPDTSLFHPGTGAIYLGQAPSGTTASAWDGKGQSWFKIAEWGATFNPFKFVLQDAKSMSATIPADIPAGEYLARVEHIAFHIAGSHELYVSCAQIKVTGGGSANPAKVSIPGYVSADDANLSKNMYYPEPTEWNIVGPAVFGSGSSPAPTTTTPEPTTVPEEPEESEVPVPEPSSEVPAPEPTEVESEEPAPEPTEVPETPASSAVPVPSPSAPTVPSPPASSAAGPRPTSPIVPAPQPTGGVKDANVCMNEYNQCIAKSQPRPDWEGCSATRDGCLANATYNSNMLARAKRSGRYGRMLL